MVLVRCWWGTDCLDRIHRRGGLKRLAADVLSGSGTIQRANTHSDFAVKAKKGKNRAVRRAARAKPPFLKIGEICLLDFRPRPLGAGSHGAVDRAFPLLATRARRNVRADSAHAEPARRRPLPRLVKSAARTRLPALPSGVVGRRRPRGTVPRLHAHRKKG